jgi:hypothetical protein
VGGPSPSPPPAGLGVGLSVGLSVATATGLGVGLSVGAATGLAVGLSVGTATGAPTTGVPLPGLLAGESTGGLVSVSASGDSPLSPVGASDSSAAGCNAGDEPVADGAVASPGSPESSLSPEPGLEAPESPVVVPAAAMPALHSRTAAHRAAAAAAACRLHAWLLRLCMLHRWSAKIRRGCSDSCTKQSGSDEWKVRGGCLTAHVETTAQDLNGCNCPPLR